MSFRLFAEKQPLFVWKYRFLINKCFVSEKRHQLCARVCSTSSLFVHFFFAPQVRHRIVTQWKTSHTARAVCEPLCSSPFFETRRCLRLHSFWKERLLSLWVLSFTFLVRTLFKHQGICYSLQQMFVSRNSRMQWGMLTHACIIAVVSSDIFFASYFIEFDK